MKIGKEVKLKKYNKGITYVGNTCYQEKSFKKTKKAFRKGPKMFNFSNNTNTYAIDEGSFCMGITGG